MLKDSGLCNKTIFMHTLCFSCSSFCSSVSCREEVDKWDPWAGLWGSLATPSIVFLGHSHRHQPQWETCPLLPAQMWAVQLGTPVLTRSQRTGGTNRDPLPSRSRWALPCHSGHWITLYRVLCSLSSQCPVGKSSSAVSSIPQELGIDTFYTCRWRHRWVRENSAAVVPPSLTLCSIFTLSPHNKFRQKLFCWKPLKAQKGAEPRPVEKNVWPLMPWLPVRKLDSSAPR